MRKGESMEGTGRKRADERKSKYKKKMTDILHLGK
jgi:hypothetical protein